MFVLSKIVAALLDPFTLVSLLLALATILLFTRRWQLGRGILAAVVTFCAVAAALPLGDWLIAPLEDRFPPPNAMPAHVDGIIVLGGAIDPGLSAARGQAQLGAAAERVTALVPLAARYPDARLVYTGGSGSVLDQDRKEAPVARQFLSSLGLDPDRVAFEDRSRNTRENALYSREIVQPSPDAVWLLVTSAIHMPRAVGVFRADGWRVLPYPVDYLTTGRRDGRVMPGLDLTAGLRVMGIALHEWLGLAYYRLRGWTDALVPAPDGAL